MYIVEGFLVFNTTIIVILLSQVLSIRVK